MLQNLKPVQQGVLRQLEFFARGRAPDELERFCARFLTQAPVLGFVPFHGAVWSIENVTSILMFRQDQFQVQLFAVPEHTVIPEHTHPNVDSFEVYVGGDIRFSHLGKYYHARDSLHPTGALGISSKRGTILRVRPDEIHGGVTGPGGGVFMSIQHWLNGVKPHCVAADYTGVAMGKDHLDKVVFGDVSTKARLSEKDAASLEH